MPKKVSNSIYKQGKCQELFNMTLSNLTHAFTFLETLSHTYTMLHTIIQKDTYRSIRNLDIGAVFIIGLLQHIHCSVEVIVNDERFSVPCNSVDETKIVDYSNDPCKGDTSALLAECHRVLSSGRYFFIYVNDLPLVLSHSFADIFADYTTLSTH